MIFSLISAIMAGSVGRFRSSSLKVSPNSLAKKAIIPSMLAARPRGLRAAASESQAGDELHRGDARQEAVGRRACRNEARKARDLDRRAIHLRNGENALLGILRPDDRVPRFGRQANGSGEFGIVYPLAQHEFVL